MTRKRKPRGPMPAASPPAESAALHDMLTQVSARLEAIEARLAHQEELAELRLAAIERQQADHETRLRAASDALVRLTTTTGLAQAFQAAFAVLLAAVAAWLGNR